MNKEAMYIYRHKHKMASNNYNLMLKSIMKNPFFWIVCGVILVYIIMKLFQNIFILFGGALFGYYLYTTWIHLINKQ